MVSQNNDFWLCSYDSSAYFVKKMLHFCKSHAQYLLNLNKCKSFFKIKKFLCVYMCGYVLVTDDILQCHKIRGGNLIQVIPKQILCTKHMLPAHLDFRWFYRTVLTHSCALCFVAHRPCPSPPNARVSSVHWVFSCYHQYRNKIVALPSNTN
jgi:hypothetical protein